MLRIITILAVLVLVAAACGGDSVSLSEVIDSGDGGGDDGGGDDDGGGSGVGSDTDFCRFNEEINNGLDAVDFFGGEPDGVAAAFMQIRDNIARAVGLAPSEIRDEVALLSEGIKGFVELLEDYDYDMFAVPEDDPRLVALSDERYDEAGDRINEFCGFEDEPDPLPEPDPLDVGGDDAPDVGLADDQVRDLVIQSLQTAFGWDAALALCVVEELGLDDPTTIDPSVFGDPTGEVCGVPFAELFGG